MILFLYGEENYLSKQKLLSIKQKYINASFNDSNLVTLDFADKNLKSIHISQIILAVPLFVKKRLVIIKNLLNKKSKGLQNQILKILPKVPKSTVLVIYEADVPDRRSKLFKILNKSKYTQEFKKLMPSQLDNWIKNKLNEKIKNKKLLKSGFIKKLILNAGNDLWKLSNEIEKISLYLNSNVKLSKQDAVNLISLEFNDSIFSLIDNIAAKNSKQVMEKFHNLIKKGENELYIFSMIVYQFRNLIIIKDLIENKYSGSASFAIQRQISKDAKINPYVAKKIINLLGNYSLKTLNNIYQMLFKYDIMIKSGKILPLLALDIMLVKICQF